MRPWWIGVAGLLLIAGCCPRVKPAVIRDWANPNFRQYRTLVDQQYPSKETRLNAYKSMAALICSADTAEKKQDSVACQCQHATSDQELETSCNAFIAAYQ